MTYDPWDWTKQVPMQQLSIPLAAMPQAVASATPPPVNTMGPLQQMVEGALINKGIDRAFKEAPPVDPSKLAPVSDAVPTLINPPTNEAVAPLAPVGTDAAAAQGAEIATTAPAAEGGFASIAAMTGK